MKLTVIDSGSKGNCYLFTCSKGETLIVEAGVKLKSIKEALDFNLKDVVGVVVSHSHL